MRLRVRLLGTFRAVTNETEKEMNLSPESTIAMVIDALLEENDRLKDVLMDPEIGSPAPNSLILLDGVEVNNLDGLDTKLLEDSEVVFLAVTHGG